MCSNVSRDQNQRTLFLKVAAMKAILRHDWEGLVRQTGPSISLYLSLRSQDRQDDGDALRLRKLAGEAGEQLKKQGVAAGQVQELLAPIDALPGSSWWTNRAAALAAFVNPQSTRILSLSQSIAAAAFGDDYFHLRPLLPLLVESDRFFVLALSERHVKLYSGDSEKLALTDVPGLPQSMQEALLSDANEPEVQTHSANAGGLGRKGAVFHGHGGKADVAESDFREYCRVIFAALEPHMRGHDEPLVLAMVREHVPTWQEVSSYPRELQTIVTGNPDHLSPTELHDRAWDVVREEHRRQEVAAYEKFCERKRAPRAAGLTQVLPAAAAGRVDTLFVDSRQPVWGTFERDSGEIAIAPEGNAVGADDLLEIAIHETVLHRGRVCPLETLTATPANVEALLRY